MKGPNFPYDDAIWAVLLMLLLPAGIRAEQVCVDSDSLVTPSTAAYVAPASTTTLKVDLLKALYKTKWERDSLNVHWWRAVQDNQRLYVENQTLWNVIRSTK